jgi:hypothetical protein
MFGCDCVKQGLHTGVIAHVASGGGRAAASGLDLIHGFLRGLLFEVEDLNMRALFGEKNGDALADTGAGPGDDDSFVSE